VEKPGAALAGTAKVEAKDQGREDQGRQRHDLEGRGSGKGKGRDAQDSQLRYREDRGRQERNRVAHGSRSGSLTAEVVKVSAKEAEAWGMDLEDLSLVAQEREGQVLATMVREKHGMENAIIPVP
jgi:hypothetical protein